MLGILSRVYTPSYTQETTTFPLWNINDWFRLRIDFRYAIEYIAGNQNGISLEEEYKLILMNSKNWNDFGFDVGMNITLKFDLVHIGSGGNTPYEYDLTVTNITGSKLSYSGTLVSFTGTSYNSFYIPGERQDALVKNVMLFCDQRPEGLDFVYGHLENEGFDKTVLNSLVDGTINKFTRTGIGSMPVGPAGELEMNKVGNQSGNAIEEVIIGYTGKVGDYSYDYYIDVLFSVCEAYENSNDLASTLAPSWFRDSNALTDNFKLSVYPFFNNPNNKVENDLATTKKLGNTGWYNENRNGLVNKFSVVSLDMRDELGTQIQKIDYSSETKITAIIEGFTDKSNVKFGYSFNYYSNDSDQYKVKPFPMHQLQFKNDGGGFDESVFAVSPTVDNSIHLGYSFSNARMNTKDIRFSDESVSRLKFEITLTPNSDFAKYFAALDTDNRRCILSISISDTGTSSTENRVSLILYNNQLDKNPKPIGEYPYFNNQFYAHPYDVNGIGTCDYHGHPEDDVVAGFNFSLLPKNSFLKSIELVNEIYDIQNLKSYELFSSVYNTENEPVVNNTQEIDIEAVSGFLYKDGFKGNRVSIQRDEDSDGLIDGVSIGYKCQYGFKIRWEDWIANPNIPSEFFNNLLKQKGLNEDWVRYSRDMFNQFQLHFAIYLNIVENGVTNRYRNAFLVKLRDYDENSEIEKTWNFFKHSDDTDLNLGIDPISGNPLGSIIDEDVRVEVGFKLLNATTFVLDEIYSTMAIQVDNGAGQFQHRQLSSIFESENDCPLKGITTDLLEIELISPTEIVVKALIKSEFLEDADRFQLSCKLGRK